METKIIWSPRAIDDLSEITSYIARDNPDAARRFGLKLIDRIELLATFPKKGRLYSREVEGVRVTVFRAYRIFYELDEDANNLLILTIRHGAREEPDFDSD